MIKRHRLIFIGVVVGAILLGVIVERFGYQAVDRAADNSGGRPYSATTSMLPPVSVTGNSEMHGESITSADKISVVASEQPLVPAKAEGGVISVPSAAMATSSERGLSYEGSAARSGRPLTPSLVPAGWQLHRIVYNQTMVPHQMRLDHMVVWNGATSVEVFHDDSGPPYGTGALQQVISAEPWKGKRIRYVAFLRTEGLNAGGYAQAFVRAETQDGAVVAFDNLPKGVLRGDTEWMQREIVIDIPESAAVVFWGAFMVGPGRMWVDSASFSLAPPVKDVTALPYERRNKNPPAETLFAILESPANGDFETGVEGGESSYVTSVLPLR